MKDDELDKHLQMDQSKLRCCQQVPGLGHTGILNTKC